METEAVHPSSFSEAPARKLRGVLHPSYDGLLNINKPQGITSHDVVNQVRHITGLQRVGHAGTLDPMATGVLLICIGSATRISEFMMAHDKVYRAIVRFGVNTSTYDLEGEITQQADVPALSTDHIQQILLGFTGMIKQRPPAYSAIKQGGKHLYELARRGKEVVVPPRQVTIFDIRLVDWQTPDLTLDVHCSPGTYIRSLAHDLGQAVGCGAHLAGLVRTRSGHFYLEDSVTLENVQARMQAHLVSIDQALDDFPLLQLDTQSVQDLLTGKSVSWQGTAYSAGTWLRLHDPQGELIGLGQPLDGRIWPKRMFRRAASSNEAPAPENEG